MLKEYPGNVTVKIDGLAASAASVIAMAGSKVLMSPVSMIMIHNPMTMAFGDTVEMEKAIAMLSEVKEGIINAYESKTGLTRTKLSHFMDAESWFNAKKAVELGFADEIMFENEKEESHTIEGAVFSKMTVLNSLMEKFPEKKMEKKTTIGELDKRLSLLKY